MNIFLQDFKELSESGQVEAYEFTPQNEERAAILSQQLSHVTVPPSQSTGTCIIHLKKISLLASKECKKFSWTF